MNPQDPLAQLQPLREPDAIGWWPPAPGWWLLAVAILLLLTLLTVWLLKRYRRNRYRKLALQQLKAARQHWLEQGDIPQFVQQINQLLKATAVHVYSNTAVAPLHGQAWLAFLTQSAPSIEKLPDNFSDAIYRPEPNCDPDAVFDFACSWIAKHRYPS